MFNIIISKTKSNKIEIKNIEDFDNIDNFISKIKNEIIKCLGEFTYKDIGGNREPNYIEKQRTFKNKYWKDVKIESFKIVGESIVLDFSEDLLENFLKIYQYSKDNEYKVIWSGAAASF